MLMGGGEGKGAAAAAVMIPPTDRAMDDRSRRGGSGRYGRPWQPAIIMTCDAGCNCPCRFLIAASASVSVKDMHGVSLTLDGKVALITGGSRGIGAECVRLFREAGARGVFNYRAAREQAETLAADCGGGKSCVAIGQELSTAEDGRALVQKTVEAFG